MNAMRSGNERNVLLAGLIVSLLMWGGCEFVKGMFGKGEKAEVERAYLEYQKALQSGSVEEVKQYVASNKLPQLELEGAEETSALARALRPSQTTIEEISVNGDVATITASASSNESPARGSIQMKKENGAWKVSDENWEIKIGETHEPAETGSPTTRSDAGPLSPSQQGIEATNATGEAVIVKEGVHETYMLKTGFRSETRFKDPRRATVQFQIPAEEFSNARRVEITLDATKAGEHYAEGKNYSIFDEDKVEIGKSTSKGFLAIFKYVADGGQIFPPKDACIIRVTSPYSGDSGGTFSGTISDCDVHSAGIDYRINSLRFTMHGVSSH